MKRNNTRWSKDMLGKLPAHMLPAEYRQISSHVPQPVVRGHAKSKLPAEKKELNLIVMAICKNGGFTLTNEYRFSKRLFKFDWAIPQLRIAVEYEGINSAKSGHTTLMGYTSNCIKYNLALRMGWKVLRYTCNNYRDAGPDLLELINQHIKPK